VYVEIKRSWLVGEGDRGGVSGGERSKRGRGDERLVCVRGEGREGWMAWVWWLPGGKEKKEEEGEGSDLIEEKGEGGAGKTERREGGE